MIGAACLLMGIAAFVTAFAWKHVLSPKLSWSAAEQQEYSDASLALQTAVHRPGRRADRPPDPQLVAAQSRLDEIQARLDRAIAVHEHGGTVLFAIGLPLTGIGGWLLRTCRQADSSDLD
jgi:hypothetical protein